MDFSKVSDEKLATLAASGDEGATDALIERYTPYVRYLARPYFLAGGDAEDLVQEGLIGFIKAIRCFDGERENGFRPFAATCIKSKLLTALRRALSKKNSPLNDYISLEAPFFDECEKMRSLADSGNPIDSIIQNEDLEELLSTLDGILSELEVKVLHLYLEGRSYQEISSICGKPQKAVDNAIQRIRKKLASRLSDSANAG